MTVSACNLCNHGGTNHYRYTYKLVILHGDPNISLVAIVYLYYTVSGGPPRSIMGTRLSDAAVHIQWHPPEQNDAILLYELHYRTLRDNWNNKTLNTTMTSVVVNGLDPTQSYVFAVRAYYHSEPGLWSSPFIIDPAGMQSVHVHALKRIGIALPRGCKCTQG